MYFVIICVLVALQNTMADIDPELLNIQKMTLNLVVTYAKPDVAGLPTTCRLEITNPEYVRYKYWGSKLLISRKTIWDALKINHNIAIKQIMISTESFELKEGANENRKLIFWDKTFHFQTYFFVPPPGETFGDYESIYFQHSGCGGRHSVMLKQVERNRVKVMALDADVAWYNTMLRRENRKVCYTPDNPADGPFLPFSLEFKK